MHSSDQSLPNKPLKLAAAGFKRASSEVDMNRDNFTRGRSLAAIR